MVVAQPAAFSLCCERRAKLLRTTDPILDSQWLSIHHRISAKGPLPHPVLFVLYATRAPFALSALPVTGTRQTFVADGWAIFIAARSNSEYAGEPVIGSDLPLVFGPVPVRRVFGHYGHAPLDNIYK